MRYLVHFEPEDLHVGIILRDLQVFGNDFLTIVPDNRRWTGL